MSTPAILARRRRRGSPSGAYVDVAATISGTAYVLPTVATTGTLHQLAVQTDVPLAAGSVVVTYAGSTGFGSLSATVTPGVATASDPDPDAVTFADTSAGQASFDVQTFGAGHPTVSGSVLFDGDDGATFVRFVFLPRTL